jgi:hypothetical protein
VIDVLRAIASAFKGQVLNNGASVFLALTPIIIAPLPELDRDRLFGCLTRFSMKEWGDFVQGVKGGDIRAQVMRQAILKAYSDEDGRQQLAARYAGTVERPGRVGWSVKECFSYKLLKPSSLLPFLNMSWRTSWRARPT